VLGAGSYFRKKAVLPKRQEILESAVKQEEKGKVAGFSMFEKLAKMNKN